MNPKDKKFPDKFITDKDLLSGIDNEIRYGTSGIYSEIYDLRRSTNINSVIMIILTIALVFLGVSEIFFSKQNEEQVRNEEEFIFSMKQRCQEEGDKFYQKKEQEAGESTIIFTPEYTYNKELNSCLCSGGSTNHITKINERFVVDIFKNTEILAIRMIDNEIIPDCYACVSSWEGFNRQKEELFSQ